MKKNIRMVMLFELILFVAVFLFTIILSGGGIPAIIYFIDLPSLILIALIFVPGMLIMGEWKDFIRSFSVGIRNYSLLELKNIIEAVGAAQKLAIYGALFAMIISGVIILGTLDDLSLIGPNLAVCFLTGFYTVIIEFLLMPLRLNAEHKMNEEMDMGDE